MKRGASKILGGMLGLVFAFSAYSAGEASDVAPLMRAKLSQGDKASLQRGAQIFMNYCSGCHSLKYLRYNRMAKDLGIVNEKGEVATEVVQNNLIFGDEKIFDPIETAMSPKDGVEWFGKMPPDLSLTARQRGVDWVYTYLHSFYQDEKAPWGSNNWLFKDTAMPNVLYPLQGLQIPHKKQLAVVVDGKAETQEIIDNLLLVSEGSLRPTEFDHILSDLVNFLAYAAEPERAERRRLGLWVLLFLFILFLPLYGLKRLYWKDIP